METLQANPTEFIQIDGIPTAITLLNKIQISDYAGAVVERTVEDGGDTLTLIAVSKKFGLLASEIERLGKRAGLSELAKYGKEVVTRAGVRLTLKPGSDGQFDYSNDPVWRQMNTALTERETFLKGLPKTGMAVADPETGEFYTAMPPTRKGGYGETIAAQIL